MNVYFLSEQTDEIWQVTCKGTLLGEARCYEDAMAIAVMVAKANMPSKIVRQMLTNFGETVAVYEERS